MLSVVFSLRTRQWILGDYSWVGVVDDFMAELSVGTEQLQMTHSRCGESVTCGCAGTWWHWWYGPCNYIHGERFILQGSVCVHASVPEYALCMYMCNVFFSPMIDINDGSKYAHTCRVCNSSYNLEHVQRTKSKTSGLRFYKCHQSKLGYLFRLYICWGVFRVRVSLIFC